MSATGADEPPTAAEQAFFQAIESDFVRLRGAAVLLSPADWQLARTWRREGIPQEVVLAGLERAFARHRERSRGGRVSSLRYCRPFVEEAWREQRELGALAEAGRPAPPLDVPARLAGLASRLPADLGRREARRAELMALAGSAEQVEAALGVLEEGWLREEEACLDEAVRAGLADQVARSLGPVQGRLDPGAIDLARTRLLRHALRRHLGLPELSLFSPGLESTEPGSGD